MRVLEPNVPWDDAWLLLRARCYATLGTPLEAEAAGLAAFRAERPPPFEAGLVSGSR